MQSRGEEIVELRPGVVHLTPDGEDRWHGAPHDDFMAHISITQRPATWAERVTDDEHGRRASPADHNPTPSDTSGDALDRPGLLDARRRSGPDRLLQARPNIAPECARSIGYPGFTYRRRPWR